MRDFPMKIFEGGNVFSDTVDIKKEFVPEIVSGIKKLIPDIAIMSDIGSAGFKLTSGDMDVFLDQDEVIKFFNSADEKVAKKDLATHLQAKGLQTAVKGRNVHIRYPLPDGTFGQVDLMVIPDAAGVAPWHQHGPRGSYNDPEFKGSTAFIIMNSIGKALGYKFDAFSGRLLDRETNEIVATGRDNVAKILLNPNATGDDLNSAKTILAALRNDPKREEKLAQAKADAAKGIISLPIIQEGSAAWFSMWKQVL